MTEAPVIFLPIALLLALNWGEAGSPLSGLPCTMIAFRRSAPILAPPPPRAQIALGPPMMPLQSTRFSPALVMRAIAMSLRSSHWKSRWIAAVKSMLSVPT